MDDFATHAAPKAGKRRIALRILALAGGFAVALVIACQTIGFLYIGSFFIPWSFFIFGGFVGFATILVIRRNRFGGLAVFMASIFGCFCALVTSAYPGQLHIVLWLFWVPALAAWAFLVGAMSVGELASRIRETIPAYAHRPLRVASVAAIVLTVPVLFTAIPLSLGFRTHVSLFRRHVESAPVLDGGERLGWLGIYYVDSYAKDSRGGVYFRLNTSPDGFFDTYSYGFAFQPSAEGSPFGNKLYAIEKLQGDWYTFRASNDW
jgi:hypothetical protein